MRFFNMVYILLRIISAINSMKILDSNASFPYTLSERLPKNDLSLQKSFSDESLFLYSSSASSADILSEVTIAK